MLETITGEIIANEIEMTRVAFDGAIMVIEGNNDEKFYKKFVDENLCHIVVAHGKENAIQSIDIVNNSKLPGVLAIVDTDFWRIEGLPELSGNIFITDTHDSEGMVFCSEAFDRIVEEYCSKGKISKYDNLRYFIYEKSRPIGYLRLASHRSKLGLVFNGLDYKKITNKGTISVNIDTLVNHILHLTRENIKRQSVGQVDLSSKTILKSYKKTIRENGQYEDKDLCCGHDIIGLFATGLRKLFSSLQAAIASKENIEKIFRLTYDFKDFLNTELAAAIFNWERNNPKYKILKPIKMATILNKGIHTDPKTLRFLDR